MADRRPSTAAPTLLPAAQAVAAGFRQITPKAGADLADDIRRCRAASAVVGPDVRPAIDADQRWNVDEAIRWTRALAALDPYWIEEPTSPDDVLGHAAIHRAVAPVVLRDGPCTAPTAPGFSAALRPESVARYTFPGGTYRAADPDTRKGQAA